MRFLTRKLVQPGDLNINGTLFGGRCLAWVDEEASIYAAIETRHKKVVTKSMSAINYPVIGLNIGGQGNFSIETRGGTPNQILDLSSGAGYVFGVNGVNRDVYHRTFPTPQNSFLPQLTTKIDGKTYPAGSYRVTVTMRRVMPLEPGMPTEPAMCTAPVSMNRTLILQILRKLHL